MSIETLAAIMQDNDEPGMTRKACAAELLDRGFGKPKQQIDVNRFTEVELTYRSVHEIDAVLRERGLPDLQRLAQMESEEIIDVTPIDDGVQQ